MGEKLTLLKPKIDVVFHALFREGNEKITKAMIQAATKEKIQIFLILLLFINCPFFLFLMN